MSTELWDVIRRMAERIAELEQWKRDQSRTEVDGPLTAGRVPYTNSEGVLVASDVTYSAASGALGAPNILAALHGLVAGEQTTALPSTAFWGAGKLIARHTHSGGANGVEVVGHSWGSGGTILINAYSVGQTGGILAAGNTKFSSYDGQVENRAYAIHFDGNSQTMTVLASIPSTGVGQSVVWASIIFRASMNSLNNYLGLPPWIAPTLLNGWVNYGSGFPLAGYYKDPFGIVHIRGLIRSGTALPGTVLFQLPQHSRPAYESIVPAVSVSAFGEIRVATNGNVKVERGDTGWISLDGITLRAEL